MAMRCTKKFSYGQVMPLTAILLGLVALSAIFLYNSNIVVTERIKLQNTADAAAYSGATMDARYLNFMAYSNRAMIADHVLTAQAIGIASEGKLLKNIGDRIKPILGKIPYYGQYVNAVAAGLNYYSTGLDYTANIEIPALNLITNLISAAQQGFRVAYPLASSSLIEKIISANDKKADLSTTVATGHSADLALFLENYSPNNANSGENKTRTNEFFDITMKSRNIFTSARSGGWTGDAIDVLNNMPLTVIQYDLRKYGGTDMSNGSSGPKNATKYKTWAAMDTLSLYTRHYKFSWTKGFYWSGWSESYPLGAGSGTAGKNYNLANDKSGNLYGNGAWRNSTAGGFASSNKLQNNNYDGLLPFVDLKAKGRIDVAPAIFVVVSKKEDDISTTRTLGVAQDSLDIAEQGSYRKNGQSSLAKGRSYFSRPQDIETSLRSTTGIKREFGNLYNPFWLPKLDRAKLSESEAMFALARGT